MNRYLILELGLEVRDRGAAAAARNGGAEEEEEEEVVVVNVVVNLAVVVVIVVAVVVIVLVGFLVTAGVVVMGVEDVTGEASSSSKLERAKNGVVAGDVDVELRCGNGAFRRLAWPGMGSEAWRPIPSSEVLRTAGERIRCLGVIFSSG